MLGKNQRESGELAKSLENHLLSFEIKKKILINYENLEYCKSLLYIGIVYVELENFNLALKYLDELSDILDEIKDYFSEND